MSLDELQIFLCREEQKPTHTSKKRSYLDRGEHRTAPREFRGRGERRPPGRIVRLRFTFPYKQVGRGRKRVNEGSCALNPHLHGTETRWGDASSSSELTVPSHWHRGVGGHALDRQAGSISPGPLWGLSPWHVQARGTRRGGLRVGALPFAFLKRRFYFIL